MSSTSAHMNQVWANELSRIATGVARTTKREPTNLLVRAQEGCPQATERLIELYQDSIYSMAVTFTKNPHQAEDLAQEAWIKILRGLPKFRHGSKFSTWLYRVTMNTFLNANRAVKREQEVLGQLSPDLGSDESSALDTAMDVQSAVRELPSEFRSVILLRYIADLSYKEIASILELPLGTVQSRLKRGLDKLGAELGDQGYSDERS